MKQKLTTDFRISTCLANSCKKKGLFMGFPLPFLETLWQAGMCCGPCWSTEQANFLTPARSLQVGAAASSWHRSMLTATAGDRAVCEAHFKGRFCMLMVSE